MTTNKTPIYVSNPVVLPFSATTGFNKYLKKEMGGVCNFFSDADVKYIQLLEPLFLLPLDFIVNSTILIHMFLSWTLYSSFLFYYFFVHPLFSCIFFS